MATYFRTIYDTNTITDSFSGTTDNYFVDRLSPQSDFTPDCSHALTDRLKVISSFLYRGNTSRTLVDTLTVRNSFAPGIDKLEFIGRPLPPFSPESVNQQPPPLTVAQLGPFNVGVATYPEAVVTFSSTRASITLKAPEFNNKDQYEQKRINEDSRGLTLIQYRDPIWPESTTYDVSFTLLDEDEIAVVLNFLRVTIGQIITYTDMYGVTHTGFIPDPESPATSAAGGYSIKFTFLEATPA